MPDTLIALAQAERELQQVRSAARQNARLDRATALSAMALLRAPDAGLRLVLAELSADYARLYDDNLRLRGELAALVALIEGEP